MAKTSTLATDTTKKSTQDRCSPLDMAFRTRRLSYKTYA